MEINSRRSQSGSASSSRRSRSMSAFSESACELTETYSPAAIDIAPATMPATPVNSSAEGPISAAATPTMRLEVERRPSLAPRTAALSQPLRVTKCLSEWWRGALLAVRNWGPCATGRRRRAVRGEGESFVLILVRPRSRRSGIPAFAGITKGIHAFARPDGGALGCFVLYAARGKHGDRPARFRQARLLRRAGADQRSQSLFRASEGQGAGGSPAPPRCRRRDRIRRGTDGSERRRDLFIGERGHRPVPALPRRGRRGRCGRPDRGVAARVADEKPDRDLRPAAPRARALADAAAVHAEPAEGCLLYTS